MCILFGLKNQTQKTKNEILIEYLDASNVFYSFDQVNYRFYKLIRTIPLYLSSNNYQWTCCDRSKDHYTNE